MITTAIVAYHCFPNHYRSPCQLLQELGKCTKNCKEAQKNRAYPALVQVHFSVSKSVSTISSFILKHIYCSQLCCFWQMISGKINRTKCQADIGDQAVLEWVKTVLDSRRNVFVSLLLDYLFHVYRHCLD